MYRPSDDFPRPSLVQVRGGARFAAWCIMAVAALALLGWVVDLAILHRPLGGWPPMSPTSAIGVGGLGLGLYCLVARRRKWGMLAATISTGALVAGLILFTSPAAAEGWKEWEVPTASLLILAVGSGGLWATLFARRTHAQLWIGVGGFVLVALAITAIFVHMVGILDLVQERSIVGASLQSAVSALLIGGSWVLLVWADDTIGVQLPNWLPAATAVSALAATGLLWGALVAREETEIARMTEQALAAERDALEREFGMVARMLRQAAAAHDTSAKLRMRTRLIEIRRDVPALDAVAILNHQGEVIAADPAGTDSAAIMRGLDGKARLRLRNPDTLSYFRITGGQARIAVLAPACPEGPCVGGIVGTLSARKLFQRTKANPAFEFTAMSVGGENYATQSKILRIGEVAWLLGASPTAVTRSRARSILPEFVLVLGVLVSALLFVTVRLGETAWRNAHTIERMRLSTALGSATEGVWEWDTAHGMLERSPTQWRQLGYVPEQRTGTLGEWLQLVHDEDRVRVENALIAHAIGERDAFEEEYRVADAEGEWHELVDRGRAVERDPGGRARRVLGITADVTRARRAERALREVDALTTMGRIAARVAHEINNPLAGIQSAFMLVKDAIPTSHPQYHYVGAIEREVGRIATVTRQLYETYRPEPIGRTESSVTTVVGDAAAFIGQLNPRITIRTVLDDVPPVVPLPAALLRQIVYNLVQNAVDASPPGGTVEVTGSMVDGELELDIRDQGSGIPEALRDRIFEPFFSTKGVELSGSGMGLGLALVQRSVAAVGGRIIIDDAPEGGARLRVRLPITRTGAPHGQSRPHPPRG